MKHLSMRSQGQNFCGLDKILSDLKIAEKPGWTILALDYSKEFRELHGVDNHGTFFKSYSYDLKFILTSTSVYGLV